MVRLVFVLFTIWQLGSARAWALRLPLGITASPKPKMFMTSGTGEERMRFITHKMCPYAQRTWIALEETGTPFEMVEIPLYGPGGKPSWFMELNPKGEVPVLTGGSAGTAIVGSEETVDYLMGSQNEVSRKWRCLINESLKPAGKQAVFSGDITRLEAVLRDLNARLSTEAGPFVCGETFTAADASAFPFLQRVHGEFGIPADCTRLREWYDAASGRPSVKKTIHRNFWWWW